MLLVEKSVTGPRKVLRVLHQASFGSNDGIVQDLPSEFDSATTFAVTSIDTRGKTFLVAIVPSFQSIVSASIEISKKETEYQFQIKNESSQSNPSVPTLHNCFIDCFADIWGRYPVVAAIQRYSIQDAFALLIAHLHFPRNLVSPETRLPPSVTFVCHIATRQFYRYFKQMIREFERVTRKPTNHLLDQILIDAAPFDELEWDSTSSSLYKAGEWLTELFCLIPIHLAVTRENRFVPLKDGVFDPALERKLLGADVSSIIDSITLGWYALFSHEPLRVVDRLFMVQVRVNFFFLHGKQARQSCLIYGSVGWLCIVMESLADHPRFNFSRRAKCG